MASRNYMIHIFRCAFYIFELNELYSVRTPWHINALFAVVISASTKLVLIEYDFIQKRNSFLGALLLDVILKQRRIS